MTFSGLGSFAPLGATASVHVDEKAVTDEFKSHVKSGDSLPDAAEKTVKNQTDKYGKMALQAGGAAACAATGAGVLVSGLCASVAGYLYGPLKDGLNSLGNLFGGDSPSEKIEKMVQKAVAARAKPLLEAQYAMNMVDGMQCEMMAALIGVVTGLAAQRAELRQSSEAGFSPALRLLRQVGLTLELDESWRLDPDAKQPQWVCYSTENAWILQLRSFPWHQDYKPPVMNRNYATKQMSSAEVTAAAKAVVAKQIAWLNDLQLAAGAAATVAALQSVAAQVPTTNQILYLAAAMTCDQLAPQGCWPTDTALVGALCAGSSIPKDVMPEVWKAFCSKLGTCGTKPLCSQQNADLVAYAAAVQAQRRNRMLLVAGAVAVGGAAWWFTRRR